MQPRIYTYKVTFEEIPDWYWGAHKEKKYGDGYLGSPDTHSWKWVFYTPILEICELFPYTDEGWREARNVENRCIKPDLNNPLCLNEHVGGLMSLEACRRGAQKTLETVHTEKDDLGRSVTAMKAHKEKDELGRSVLGVKASERLKKDKDELGRSVMSVKGATASHKEKDEFGRSINAVRGGKAAHKEKDDLGRSLHALKIFEKVHEEKDELGRSVLGVKGAERLHKEKDEFGRSINSVKGASITTSQKWEDPQHPELGHHNPGNLVKLQKRLGLPHGKENRIKVG